MTDDVRQAFDHPEERARATSPDDPRDRISLRDHVVKTEIGAFQSERGSTQRLRFDLVVEVRPHGADLGDDVDRILSYDTLTEAIAAELGAERLNLLETLAERIAARILAEPLALRCFVRIEKLDRGSGALGVEIARSAGATPPGLASAGPRPLVVFLPAAAIASAHLSSWLDQIEARVPAVLCVGPPDAPPVRSDDPDARHRIGLLAIEQIAWVVAGLDQRCLVVETRTELDWAIRNRRIAVWAPSKLILNAADPPGVGDGTGPAAWLAEQLDARRLVFVGAAPPRTRVPATVHPLGDEVLP